MGGELPLLVWILGFALLGSAASLAGAALLLLSSERTRRRLLPSLVSYAVGALLGAAFLVMLPKALQDLDANRLGWMLLGGLFVFFLLEKLLRWRQSLRAESERKRAAGPLILAGDALHNLVDGFVIAGAFLTSIPLGITTGLAILAHELPQELSDFAILLDSGYGRFKALLWNFVSSLAAVPGAVVGYFFLDTITGLRPYVLALAAASFIYIAIADLVPDLHAKAGMRATALQVALILAGALTIVIVRQLR